MPFVTQGFWLVLAFVLILTLEKYLSYVLENISKKFSYPVFPLYRDLIMWFHSIWLSSCLSRHLFFSVEAFISKLGLIFWFTFFTYVKRKDNWKMIWNIRFYYTRPVLNATYYNVCNNVIYSCGCLSCYVSWSV